MQRNNVQKMSIAIAPLRTRVALHGLAARQETFGPVCVGILIATNVP